MKIHKATLAGGCFWGVQELIRNLPGVIKTQVGYTGGETQNPVYDTVKTGSTGHAEAIEIEFDSHKITYEEILEFFFIMHNPTTLNQQGNDKGSQYRSEIFYHSEEQKEQAYKVIQKVESSKKWGNPIVTKVTSVGQFYSAESFHQDYLQKNPGGYTCHYIRQ